MEQNTEILLSSATEDEILCASILLDLENLISLSESNRPKSVWGCKKKRSCLDSVDPSSVPAAEPAAKEEIEVKRLKLEVKEDSPEPPAPAAAPTSSPDTPLSFSPSESDDKNGHSFKKTSKKMSREEYIEMMEGLTACRGSLEKEIENVKKYYDRLKAYNSQLKAAKQKALKTSPMGEDLQKERLGNESTQRYPMSVTPHHPPSIADPTALMLQRPIGPITIQLNSYASNGLDSVNHVGPSGIPDLNLPPDEVFGVADPSQPSDVGLSLVDERERCAEARRIRRGIIKSKAMRNTFGNKLPKNR